jgi:hypothetical protein
VDGHRRYADESEPGWYSAPGPYADPAQNPYDSGIHERPSGAFRLPEQRESDYATPSPYVSPDPVTSTGGHSQDQLRIPVRGPEYPTVRPSGGTSLADAPPATTYGGGSSAPASAAPAPLASSAPVSAGPAALYNDPGPAPYTDAGAAAPYTDAGAAAPYTDTGAAAPYTDPGAAAPYNDATSVVPPVGRFSAEPRPADSVYRTRRPFSAVLVALVTLALMIPVIMLLVQATFDDDPLASGIVPAVLLTLGLPLTGMGLYALAGGGPVGRESWLRPPVAYLPVGLVLLLAAGLAVA